MKLSAIIITRNGESQIGRCIDSVSWADEVIIVDSGSTDRTVEICRERGAKVWQTPDFPGHGPQKNRALDHASGEWILSLDSDEWATPDLRREVEAAMADPRGHAAFAMPRRSSFCGQYMKHSGWWPDYVTRLFRRDSARFSEDHTHDRLIVNGAMGKLKSPVYHEAITDLDQMIAKMNLYSTSSSKIFYRHGRRASFGTALLHGWWAFMRTYFLRLGFLDGRAGLMLAIANAEGSYYRYLKLMLLSERGEK